MVGCFEDCAYRYKLRYIDRLKVIQDPAADDPLVIGTALHTGIERGIHAAIREYYAAYNAITDENVLEAMKLECQIEKARNIVPEGEFEKLISNERFRGYLDLLAPVKPGVFDLWDFKYSNHVDRYADSGQLHIYKYFFEKTHPRQRIRNMQFLVVPKVQSKIWNGEDLFQYRQRIMNQIQPTKPVVLPVEYNPAKVLEFMEADMNMRTATVFEKNEGWMCKFCEYADYCQKGRTYMLLPSNERRNISETKKRKIWIYGAAFSGKTTMLDKAPDPLNLNTDGNIQFVTMPYIAIKDQVTVEGRITRRKWAWEVFKETIDELEKKQNTFQTIIIDLLEDTREMCRVYMYDKLKIQHESDAGYGKGWDIIKTEYLTTIRRFFNMDYENLVVVSHEDVSKDITKKNGQNITRIAPNIQDAVANKVAGMVDIVARVVAEEDGTRTLNFKPDEVIFGGGRLKGIRETTVPLSWDALMGVYEQANEAVEKGTASDAPEAPNSSVVKKVEEQSTKQAKAPENVSSEATTTPEADAPAMNPPESDNSKAESPVVEPNSGEVMTDANEPGKRTRRTRRTANN